MDAPPTPLPVCHACGRLLVAEGGGVRPLCPGCLLEFALAPSEGSGSDHFGTILAAEEVEGLPPGSADGLRLADVTAASHFAHYQVATDADGLPVELGRGAMGTTYRAVDTVLRSAVALKVVRPEVSAHPRARARFLREAQAAAGLRHPHVASVFFFGERPEDGQPFYAMELVEGETLEARVRRAGGLPVDAVLEIGSQVADALAAAEARGLTHRDLKPANLMLVEGEGINVKVIDFGLAKAAAAAHAGEEARLTRIEDFVGTPAFASPEQFAASASVDARSDFYALGATLWYALTSRPPVTGTTVAEIRERQLHAPLPVEQLRAARVSPPVVDLLRSLLSPDPSGRPQTARELAVALADCRQPHRQGRHAARAWSGREWAAVFGVLLLGAVLLVGLHRRTDAVARQSLAQQQQLAAVQAQLQQQTQLIALVSAKIERNASSSGGGGGAPDRNDPALAAQGEIAWERGISVETLRQQLAGERDDVRQLLAQIDQRLSAAQAQIEQWQRLKVEALIRLGEGEYAAGQYLAAVEPYRQALALADPDKEPLAWCEAADKLQPTLRRLARYPDAATLARQTVDRRTALQGPEHPATLKAVHDQALLAHDQGDTAEAEALYRRVLEAQERTLGREYPDTLNTAADLAYLLHYRGKDKEAETLGRRCVEACERTLGKEHPDTLRSLNTLAIILYHEGIYAESVSLNRRCLEGRERLLGPDHPDTIIAVNNLALGLHAQGDRAGAEPLYRRALAAQERTLGPEHPLTLSTVNNLGNFLGDKGDHAGAVALGRRALEARERVLGPDHHNTLSSLSNLAQTLDEKGDLAAAEPLYQQAQARMDRLLSPQDVFRLDLEHYFSLFREKQGRLAEALALAAQAAEGCKELPADSPLRRTYEQHFQALREKVTATAAPPSPAGSIPLPTAR